ncbi:MAG: hypothetical protein HPY66_0372 [Firmicutes bacterium]|nr:hypothetical protein [Bacillota bacterium]NPV28358.1 hypothetical protein [Bacillota bacterium]
MGPWKMQKLYGFAIIMTLAAIISGIITKDYIWLCFQLGVLYLQLSPYHQVLTALETAAFLQRVGGLSG